MVTSIPTPYTLGLRRYVAGTKDAHGNTGATFSDPEPLPAHFVAPGSMTEPAQTNRDLSLVAYTIGVQPGTLVTERDRVLVDGIEYEIDGRPADWTRGPWSDTRGGIIIELRKAEG